MRFGLGEIVLLTLVILMLFGAGRISQVMGEFGKGLRSFKDGLKGEELADGKTKILPPEPRNNVE